ncbi:MAG: hypothetical protein WD889_00070 [Candidatus Colwellbacteria bacterium]
MVNTSPKSLTQLIILGAATGIILTSPYGGKLITGALHAHLRKRAQNKEWERKLNAQNVSRALYALKKRRQIKIESRGNKTIIKLTERGHKRKLEYEYENIKIAEPPIWDKKWRLLMFDIPDEARGIRDSFRLKLKGMGFIPFQKSVWIYPYSCEDEIDFVTEYLRIGRYLSLLTVRIENDLPLREKFNL